MNLKNRLHFRISPTPLCSFGRLSAHYQGPKDTQTASKGADSDANRYFEPADKLIQVLFNAFLEAVRHSRSDHALKPERTWPQCGAGIILLTNQACPGPRCANSKQIDELRAVRPNLEAQQPSHGTRLAEILVAGL